MVMDQRRSNKRLGELLVERGMITATQLGLALQHQQVSKRFLGEILVELGVITPQALLEALSQQYGLPQQSLSPQQVDWTLTKKFPTSVLTGGRCFPVRADAGLMVVAISNPLDAEALSEVGQFIGALRVAPVLVLEKELQEVVKAYRLRALQNLSSQLGSHGA